MKKKIIKLVVQRSKEMHCGRCDDWQSVDVQEDWPESQGSVGFIEIVSRVMSAQSSITEGSDVVSQ